MFRSDTVMPAGSVGARVIERTGVTVCITTNNYCKTVPLLLP